MKTNQLKIGVILSYITMFAQNIIGILYTPIMLRLLGKSEYGLYQLVYSVVSYLGLLSFGFGSAYVRFYSRYKVKNDEDGIARLNGMFITIFLIIALISVLAGSVLVFNVELIFKQGLTPSEISTARILMILMVFNLAVTFPSSVFDSYVTAHECYFFQRVVSLLQTVLNPFLTLPLLLMGYKSISLIVVTTILTVGKFIMNMYYCRKKIDMRFKFKNMQFSLLKEIWVFSFFIFLNMIVDQINWSVDKFILGMFGGTVAVAVYAVGGQINTLYMSLSTSVSSVFIPRINTIVADNDDNNQLTDIFTRVGRIQFIVLALVLNGFILLGKYFISVWAGNGYDSAYYVVLLLIIPVTVPLIQNLGIEIQRAKNMHKFRSIIYFMIAIGNVLISIPLTKAYGEVGAAFGTAITMTLGNIIIMNWYYHARVKLNMKYFWSNIFKLFPAILISFSIGLIASKIITVNSIINFIFVGCIYAISYLICMYLFGLNSYEKGLFDGAVNKVLRRRG
ncbi:MAG: polysaccharide biosynthesis protein [[Clostridium] spiroforme]|uniref:oligosaccharide flippase family protein n=1 Tax=Thomasclavelia spiroformis TaxID=29348 RepID=UPI001E0D3BD8|nr:oligosaccharide flippase family protein [Thomasclavelia spiroformis]MBS7216930.1 polysaccharide biosynthesis protein [Thomasclavelia spiroformis]